MIQIPNLQIPDWDTTQFDGGVDTPNGLHRYETTFSEDFDVPIHLFSSDQFRMFEFKVRNCQRGRSHDWTECPYAHPGEKARRRDPRKYHYSGTPCPEFRKGNCNKGDSCKFSHGVFECWLHPSRYRTQLCKDGTSCRRRVCFFAHTNEQLRFLSHTESFLSSPTSVLNSSSLSDSPTGNGVVPFGKLSVGQIVGSMRNVKLDDGPSGSPRVFGSPRGGFLSTTTTTTTLFGSAEEPVMERVESGKDLRAKIYAKLRKENFNNAASFSAPIPDIGWVSELVK